MPELGARRRRNIYRPDEKRRDFLIPIHLTTARSSRMERDKGCIFCCSSSKHPPHSTSLFWGGRTLTHVDPRTCHLFRPFHPIERTCITRLSITRMQLTITSRLWGPSSPYRPPVRSDYSNCVAIARISLKNKTAHSRRVVQ